MIPLDARGSAVLETWCPADGPQPLIVRWLMTEWCNYQCPYCPQTHDRFAVKDAFTAHAFDNHPLARWIEAFDRHFSGNRLSLVITGGEPMLDARNMPRLISHFVQQEYVACVRIDTNASWSPEKYHGIDVSKIILMCTFHPSEISEEHFLSKLRRLRDSGFRIGMVNYVMHEANVELFRQRRRAFLDEGLLLHPNPLWDTRGQYSESDREMMEQILPAIDYRHRSGLEVPRGAPCLFPSISYELRYTGVVSSGCSAVKADFFADSLPERPAVWATCPHQGCFCLDKYSFRRGSERNTSLNPLQDYADALRAKSEGTSHADGLPA